MKVLKIKSDGVYLDERKLKFITEFRMETKADWGATRIIVKGFEADHLGNPVVDEFAKEFAEYEIDTLVIVDGLDNVNQEYTYV